MSHKKTSNGNPLTLVSGGLFNTAKKKVDPSGKPTLELRMVDALVVRGFDVGEAREILNYFKKNNELTNIIPDVEWSDVVIKPEHLINLRESVIENANRWIHETCSDHHLKDAIPNTAATIDHSRSILDKTPRRTDAECNAWLDENFLEPQTPAESKVDMEKLKRFLVGDDTATLFTQSATAQPPSETLGDYLVERIISRGVDRSGAEALFEHYKEKIASNTSSAYWENTSACSIVKVLAVSEVIQGIGEWNGADDPFSELRKKYFSEPVSGDAPVTASSPSITPNGSISTINF